MFSRSRIFEPGSRCLFEFRVSPLATLLLYSRASGSLLFFPSSLSTYLTLGVIFTIEMGSTWCEPVSSLVSVLTSCNSESSWKCQ